MRFRVVIPRLAAALILSAVCVAFPAGCAISRPVEKPSELPAAPSVEPAPMPIRVGQFSGTWHDWRPIFKGIEYSWAEAQGPRPLKVHAVRIDLLEPTISFFATPSNGDAPLETSSMFTSTFLVKYGCQIAVNASPFNPVVPLEGRPQDVLGVSVSQGDAFSREQDGYGAVLITRDNKVKIGIPPFDLSGVWNAVGGFGLLLKDGLNVGDGGAIHPRTAIGLTRDERYFIILVTDGRQQGYSEGTTTAETADWLAALGAWQALNLDGGGSTALVISDCRGGWKTLNRPINMNIPGMQRAVANHLGVRAAALE
ncbi:MAG TPA: phosphodiester glycosidase family protein [Candidatus Brocadiia bacterium]|nr:phosphodiester glycosidase family protein [Candidatus Brocadiia bacterium]